MFCDLLDPVNKISRSDPDCIGSCTLIMVSGLDQSNELSVLDGNDGSLSLDSPQDILMD